MKEIQDKFKLRYIFYTVYGWGLFAVVFAVLFLIASIISIILSVLYRGGIIW